MLMHPEPRADQPFFNKNRLAYMGNMSIKIYTCVYTILKGLINWDSSKATTSTFSIISIFTVVRIFMYKSPIII